MSHTKEPWRIIERRIPHRLGEHIERNIATAYIDGQLHDHYPVVSVAIGIGKEGEPPVHFLGTSEANARRIVACVNACAGIDTEMLEVGCVPVQAKAMAYKQQCDQLEREKAELLEAVVGVIKEFERIKSLSLEKANVRDVVYLNGVLAVLHSRLDKAIASESK